MKILLIIPVLFCSCKNEGLKEVQKGSEELVESSVVQQSHPRGNSADLDRCLSMDPSLSVPETELAVSLNQKHLLELVWLRGDCSEARKIALDYLMEPETIDAELFIEELSKIRDEFKIRIDEVRLVEEGLK